MATASCTKEASCRKEDEKMRSKTCLNVLHLSKIISCFKENPQVSKEVCENYSTVRENDKMLSYHNKVTEILLEAEKKMLQFNKLGVLMKSFRNTISILLIRLHTALKENHKNIGLKYLSPSSGKHKDCPDVLLEVEKRKLKDYRCILQLEIASLDKHYQKMELVQYRMSELVKYIRRNKKFLERRFKTPRQQHNYQLYCPDEGEKLKFGEKEINCLIYNFCDRVCVMDRLAEEGKMLLENTKKKVDQAFENKSTLFQALNNTFKDQLKQLKQLTNLLNKAIINNNLYRAHMTRRLTDIKKILITNPNCEHALKYVEDTEKGLRDLHLNDQKLRLDKARKVEATHIDDIILHNRAYARKFI